MSYLPDLRASLVKAAHREREAAEGPRTRSRRSVSFGGVAALLAAAGAIAVAVLAVAVLGHGHPTATNGGGAGKGLGPAQKQAAARAAAARTLNQLVLPPGAVRSGLVPGTPAELFSPADRLPALHVVDVHRVWRVPGNPEQVINFIQSHPPPGSAQAGGSESGSGPPKGGPVVVTEASATFEFPVARATTVVRELAVRAVRARGGGSIVRADGEAGWIVPRSAAERIPAGTDRLLVTTGAPEGASGKRRSTSRRAPRLHTLEVTSPARIRALVALLNSLPRAQPGVFRCLNGSGPRIRFVFYSAGSAARLATAVFVPSCSRIRLAIGGRAQADLAIGGPAGNPVQEGAQLKELFSFGVPGGGGAGAPPPVQTRQSSAPVHP